MTTIFPLLKISAVVFGSRIRMMTAAKRYSRGKGTDTRCWNNPVRKKSKDSTKVRSDGPTFGLYSAFRACKAMFFKSSFVSRSTVATTFLFVGDEHGSQQLAGRQRNSAAMAKAERNG